MWNIFWLKSGRFCLCIFCFSELIKFCIEKCHVLKYQHQKPEMFVHDWWTVGSLSFKGILVVGIAAFDLVTNLNLILNIHCFHVVIEYHNIPNIYLTDYHLQIYLGACGLTPHNSREFCLWNCSHKVILTCEEKECLCTVISVSMEKIEHWAIQQRNASFNLRPECELGDLLLYCRTSTSLSSIELDVSPLL